MCSFQAGELRPLKARVQMQQCGQGIGGEQAGQDCSCHRVWLTRHGNGSQRGQYHGRHCHCADDYRAQPPDHPTQQKQTDYRCDRHKDLAVAEDGFELRHVNRHRSSVASVIVAQPLGVDGACYRNHQRDALCALAQRFRAHGHRQRGAIPRRQHSRREAVAQHTLASRFLRLVLGLAWVKQAFDREAVTSTRNLLQRGDRGDPIDQRVDPQPGGEAVHSSEELATVQVLALEDDRQYLVVRKVAPQCIAQ